MKKGTDKLQKEPENKQQNDISTHLLIFIFNVIGPNYLVKRYRLAEWINFLKLKNKRLTYMLPKRDLVQV